MFENSDIPSAVMTLINEHGGLEGLLEALQSGGLKSLIAAWMGQSNLADTASPQQLSEHLDPSAVESAAQQHGMSSNELLQMASQYLPQILSGARKGDGMSL